MKTKKLLLSIAAIAVLAAMVIGCKATPEPDFLITGDIEGVEGEVYFTDGKDTLSSTSAVDGKFTISGVLPEPGHYIIVGQRFPIALPIDKGDSINIVGSMKKFKPGTSLFTLSGTHAIDELNSMGERVMGVMQVVGTTRDINRRDSMQLQLRDIVLETADKNIDNVLGIYLLSNELPFVRIPSASMSEILVKTPEKYKETELYKKVEQRIETIREAELRSEAADNPETE